VSNNIDITGLLQQWQAGDGRAIERLMPLLYEQLKRLASAQMRGEKAGHTLQPTALVHEAWMRLAEIERMPWESRNHFIALAATTMRRVLVDHARARQTAKRGDGVEKVSLTELWTLPGARGVDLEALDAALADLERLDPQQARIVELKFFAGLSVQETAVTLGISERTVKRDWASAKAWLRMQMSGAAGRHLI
jgi:RNA polymerase sigma factor (TIGR02999 family)